MVLKWALPGYARAVMLKVKTQEELQEERISFSSGNAKSWSSLGSKHRPETTDPKIAEETSATKGKSKGKSKIDASQSKGAKIDASQSKGTGKGKDAKRQRTSSASSSSRSSNWKSTGWWDKDDWSEFRKNPQ